MKNDAVEELIKEIAVTHGIGLSRDDPILVLHTINARLLEDSAKAQRALMDQHKQELELIAQRWSLDAKDKADKILNASLTTGKESMSRLMEEGATSISTKIRSQVEQALQGIDTAAHQARDFGRINLIAAAVTLIAAAITLFATLTK